MPRTPPDEYATNATTAQMSFIKDGEVDKVQTFFTLNVGRSESSVDSLDDLVTGEIITSQEKTDLLAILGKIRTGQCAAKNLTPPT
jgi:hypothetical protein